MIYSTVNSACSGPAHYDPRSLDDSRATRRRFRSSSSSKMSFSAAESGVFRFPEDFKSAALEPLCFSGLVYLSGFA